MGLRKVLFIIGGASFACLLICLAVLLVGLRVARNSVQEDVANAISTTVANQIAMDPRTAGPRTITILPGDLAHEITMQYEDQDISVDDVIVYAVAPNQLVIGLRADSREFTYTATLAVVDGKIDVVDMVVNNRGVRFLLPGNKVAGSIEDGINDALFAQNYQMQSLSIERSSLILTIITGPTSS